MKSIYFILSLLLLAVCIPIQGQEPLDTDFNNMLSKLLKHSVTEIDPNTIETDAIFLDAREREEFEVSHLPNAIHVGYNNFNIDKWLYLIKEKNVVVYCSVGYRSEKIAEQFQKNGFQNIKNLYGGIFEWVHQNKPIVKNNKTTDSIHTFNKEWSKWLKKGIKVY